MSEISLVVCPPSECSKETIERCLDLICLGGAIPASKKSVRPRVMRAEALVLASMNHRLIGVGALKIPVQSYRDDISIKSGFPIPAQKYPFELGYIAVDKSARGQKLSPKLVDAVLDAAGNNSLFSTTSHGAMHTILPRAGFVRQGNTYEGNDGNELTLYIRD